ncbi:inositol monophosphatase family protein [Halobaculum gomorrense]|uniref:fructose-bisphosphatase n=1 Tax=Halobaculum gomorrense TaxID=43928 RepID=A0A1M5S5J5_9EURY|nr:inositol monophosphatase [Halobaculum gomorrense]SHH33756.1 myo-inositol-1(or 4)-monophosphatase [Halobaculum gomorrense]
MTAQERDGADRAAVAEAAARAGAAVAGDWFRDGIDIEHKDGKTDVVTEADRAGQRAVIERVREDFPDDAIVGEEEDELKAVPESGAAWVIDPIDGTNNYVRDIRAFATAVAAVVDGEPVAAATVLPAMDDVYAADGEATSRNGTRVSVSDRADPETAAATPTVWWDFDARDEYARACAEIVERFGDMRRFGSAQVTLAMVAEGALDATITNVDCNPWDTVAGVHMVRVAGGTVTDLDGDHWSHDSSGLVASNGGVHGEALAAARAVRSVAEE